MTSHKHGGDLDYVQSKYNIPKEQLIDFSSNLNPLGYPKKAMDKLIKNLSISSTYPDKEYKNLKSAIAKYTESDVEHIVVGNGSTELISLFIQTSNSGHSVILAPSYSEYERELSVKGGTFSYFPLEEKDDFQLNLDGFISALNKEIGLVIICNPNNPTGTVLKHKQILPILEHCRENGISVMIDETYVEFTENIEDVTAMKFVKDFENLFIIRGTSKFFALAGIRLGYGVCSSPVFLDLVKEHQNPWSVNHIASFLGEEIFADDDFKRETNELINRERDKIFNEISEWDNCKIYKTSSNFMLIKLLNENITSSYIYEKCLQEKMVIRNCSSFTFLDERYIRFCIMTTEDNELLLKTLKSIIHDFSTDLHL